MTHFKPHLIQGLLISFFAFLRISNVAPHSAKQFDPLVHFLRKDVIFCSPGAHLILKWTKTLQDHKLHHLVQIPALDNVHLCPVRALRALFDSRQLSPEAPLFVTSSYTHLPILDSHIRNALRSILRTLNLPLDGFSFHTFRRSGATFVFDHNVSIQNIMIHGSWRSSAVWIYLQNASIAPSVVPQTFATHIPSYF